MYKTFETDGFFITINNRFLDENTGKEFLDIGIEPAVLGKIERDNITVKISYLGFGELRHKRTGQIYDNIKYTKDQWEKVKVHFRSYPELYEYRPTYIQITFYEAEMIVKSNELYTNCLDFPLEQLLIKLYVQHVACKTTSELLAIKRKTDLSISSL